MIASSPLAVTAIVLAKWPRAGLVKTRLCPPLEPSEAATLAAAALADTFDAVAGADVARRVAVLDGAPEGWSRHGFETLPQRGDGLAERLAAAFADVGGPAVLVGMDTPQLTTTAIEDAATRLVADGIDAVLGRAVDGGYWLVGLREPDERVFSGVPMSRPDTGAEQLARLRDLGQRVSLLGTHRDVDDISEAIAVAMEAPTTRFAHTLDVIRGRLEARLARAR